MKKDLKEATYNLDIEGLETTDASSLERILSLAGVAQSNASPAAEINAPTASPLPAVPDLSASIPQSDIQEPMGDMGMDSPPMGMEEPTGDMQSTEDCVDCDVKEDEFVDREVPLLDDLDEEFENAPNPTFHPDVLGKDEGAATKKVNYVPPKSGDNPLAESDINASEDELTEQFLKELEEAINPKRTLPVFPDPVDDMYLPANKKPVDPKQQYRAEYEDRYVKRHDSLEDPNDLNPNEMPQFNAQGNPEIDIDKVWADRENNIREEAELNETIDRINTLAKGR